MSKRHKRFTQIRRKAKNQIQNADSLSYGFHCLAFLDILGQRRILRQLPRIPNKDEETTRLLGETVGYVLKLRRLLSSCFDQFRLPTPPLSVVPVEVQKRVLDARQIVKYRGFSDSIIMSVSFKGDDEQYGPVVGVYGCLAACAMLHLIALSLKRPIRGGVDVGLGMQLPQDEIYGPVLERAHQLEAEVADYPRILVGDELWDYLTDIEQQPATTPFGRSARIFAGRSKEFITLDTDGNRMLDFLGEAMVKLTPADQREKLFPPASEYIAQQIEVGRSNNDEKHLSRYTKLRQYFDKRSTLWQSVDV